MTSTEVAVRANTGLPEKIEYATQLAKSDLLPAQYMDKPANILLVMEFGEYLGLPPVAALRLIHIIDNKPVASAELISGRVRNAGHRLRVRYDPESKAAVCSIWRSDDPSFEFRTVWTWDRAAAVHDKYGKPLTQKMNWRNYYPVMLKWRAVTECARDACPEVLLGVSYSPDELGAQEIHDDEADYIGVMTRHQRVEHEQLRRMGEAPAGAVEKLTEPDPDDPWAAPPAETASNEVPKREDPSPQPAGKAAIEKLDRLVKVMDLGPDEDVHALFEWLAGGAWTATRQQVTLVMSWLNDHVEATNGDMVKAASAVWTQYRAANPQAADDGA